MDHSRIYQYRFDELLSIIKGSTRFRNFEEREDDHIIDICGNDFREYQGIISRNETWVIYTIEKIVMSIFDQEGINYEIPSYEETSVSGRTRKVHPFAFSMVENKRNIAYVFLYRQKKGLIEIRQNIKKYSGIDGVRFYFLQRDFKKEIDMLNGIESKEDASFLEFYSIEDFFNQKFKKDEYPQFISYVEKFNERARNLIGFKTVVMPTEDVIKKFRINKAEFLRVKNYDSLLPNSISLIQKKRIIGNYVGNSRFLIMTGNADFADSFVSSEWYYGIHTVTGTIDQTGLVTGYLKSVEQLLYTLIRLSINKNRRISINAKMKDSFTGKIYGDRFIDFTEANEAYADTTLGSLIHFVKNKNKEGDFYNADLFEVDSSTIQAIIDALYSFKDVERNDHLHKDNLYTAEEVEDIRNKAITLYCLLLGCFRINSAEYTRLMSYDTKESLPDFIDEEALTEIITEWVTPILMFDIPKESGTVAFMVVRGADNEWDLCVQGLKEIPKGKYKSIEWNYRMIYSSSMTNNRLNWKSDGEFMEEEEKLLRVFRKLINENNEVATMLRKYNEVAIGSGEVIEVLYSKL